MEFTLIEKAVLLSGKRGSGKTVLARDLLEKEGHRFSAIFLFSPTEKTNHDYEGLVKPNCVYDRWSDKWCAKLFERQASVPKDKMKNILIVCDDLGSESDLNQHRDFVKVFTRGRHLKIAILFLSQYVSQIPKICRANLDYVLCSQQNAQSIDIMTDEFNNHLKPIEFRELYRKATKDYGFFTINNTNVKDADNLNSVYGIIRADTKGSPCPTSV